MPSRFLLLFAEDLKVGKVGMTSSGIVLIPNLMKIWLVQMRGTGYTVC
jgi:hypothetical protein